MKTRATLLSVVIPAHNVETWIDETLQSILSQDVPDMEVIVVDDGSDDDTRTLLARWATRDPRLQVVLSEGVGGGSARNLGAEHASGTYLIFADADDIVPRGAYRALVDQLERTGSDMAAGRYLKFSASRTWDPTQNWPVYKSVVERTTLRASPALIRGRACWNKLFRRDFWRRESLYFPDVARSNDILPMTTAMSRASTIDAIPDVVYLYRERPGLRSMTAKAASVTGVLSYLDQEVLCGEELSPAPSSPLANLYARLLLEADLWVHLMRLVAVLNSPSDDEWPPDVAEEIGARLDRLLRDIPREMVSQLRPEQRAVYELLSQRKLTSLRGLNAVGTVGRPETFGVLEQVPTDWQDALRLRSTHPGFEHLPLHFLRDRVLRPLENAIDRGDEVEAQAWSRMVPSLLLAGELGRMTLTPSERSLVSIAGDVEQVRVTRSLRATPRPLAVSGHQRNSYVITLPPLPPGANAQLVARERDTTGEAELATVTGQPSAVARVSGSVLRTEGVWKLELRLRLGSIVVDIPIVSPEARPTGTANRWHRTVSSAILRPGDQIVVVRRRALPVRLVQKFRQRLSR